MARRTTSELVRSICHISAAINLEGFIDTATEMVDRVEEIGGETDEQRLELIERWLTAHMASITVEPQETRKQIDITEIHWAVGKGGDNLNSTPYGRQALALDRTFTLEKEYGTKSETVWIGDNDPDAPNPA